MVYGPSNNSLSGGIVNNPGSVCEIENCNLYDADTHSIYVDNSNLTIKGSNTRICPWAASNNDGAGIWINGNSNVTIEQLTINNTQEFGIKCTDVSNVTIQDDVTIKDTDLNGIYASGSTVVIINSTIDDVGGLYYNGISAYEGSNLTIQNVTIIDVGCNGIGFEDSIGEITDSFINNSGSNGIYAKASTLTVQDNIISFNGGSGAQLDAVNGSTISGNTINNNSYNGIHLLRSAKSTGYRDPGLGTDEYSDESILLKLKSSYSNGPSNIKAIKDLETKLDAKMVTKYQYCDVMKFTLNKKVSINNLIIQLSKDPRVQYAEPDYIFTMDKTANDTNYSYLWGLHNTGQNGGTADADIDAPEAWDITTGTGDVIVAIVDTGIDYFHRDIVNNTWTNPNEIADGNDTDNNGYVDDIHGVDTHNNDGDPMDDNNHGTHVAGTIGAEGNNSQDVVGVNWNVSMIGLKAFSNIGRGKTSNIIESMDYMLMMKKDKGINVSVCSNSWSGSYFSQALYDVISDCRDEDILFVASAGNTGENADYWPRYPAAYNLTNIISVTSTDRNDEFCNYNYGKSSVDVAAPGYHIHSTITLNRTANYSGTSMAVPHVSGQAALLSANNSSLNYNNLKYLILSTVDTLTELEDIVVTDGRINANSALTYQPAATYMNLIIHTPVNSSNVLKGVPVEIVASVNNAALPITNATLSVNFSNGDSNLTLYDNGVGVDQVSGDGYYSGTWTPQQTGIVVLNISASSNFYTNTSKNITLNVVGTNTISNNIITGNSQYGISLYENSNSNSIINNTISSNQIGIRLKYYCFGNDMRYNNITKCGMGVYFRTSQSNNFAYNHLWNNSDGVILWYSSGNTIANNVIANDNDHYDINGTIAIRLYVSNDNKVSNNVISKYDKGISVYNTVNFLFDNNKFGLMDQQEVINESVGGGLGQQLGPHYLNNGYVINCTLYENYSSYPWNPGLVGFFSYWYKLVEGTDYTLDYLTGEINIITTRGSLASFTRYFHAYYNYSEIGAVGSVDFGVYVQLSSRGDISNNIMNFSTTSGITVQYSDNMTLYKNSVYNSSDSGFDIGGCDDVLLSYNNASSNIDHGFYLSALTDSTTDNNDACSNVKAGIYLDNNDEINTITSNTLISNGCGINATDTENNTIYHNRLFGNTDQAFDSGANNSWDNGYPSGGNYWDDYNGTDVYGGPGQNLSGCDGIGDEHYNSTYGYGINGTASSEDSYPLMSSNVQTNDYWAKSYGGNGQDYARSIQPTSDGGSVVAGYTYSDGAGGADYWILKLSSNGSIEWETAYGSIRTDMAYSVNQTSDGGYIVAGKSNINGPTNYDFLVLKLDSDGDIEWNKTYGNSSTDIAYSIQETSDDGFIVAGQSYFAGRIYDGWVVKLDEDGVVLWQKAYGGTGVDIIYSIQETSDNGFVFAGQTSSSGAGSYDYWVVKVNDTGVLEWNKTYGGGSAEYAYTVQETSDNGFIVAGQTNSYGNGSTDYWVLKLDENGTVEWEKTYGNTSIDSAYPIQQTSDGGFIIGGTALLSAGAGNYDYWIVKVNETGIIEWQKTYGGTNYDRIFGLSETVDGEYIVAGYTSSFGAGASDFWIMDLGYEGRITFDYGSGAYVNTTLEVPFSTSCSVGNATSTVRTTFLSTNTPTVSVNDTSCTVEIQATPSYGWY